MVWKRFQTGHWIKINFCKTSLWRDNISSCGVLVFATSIMSPHQMPTKLMSFCVWSHSVTILYCPEFDIHTARKWDFWIQVSSSHPPTWSMRSMSSIMDVSALSLGISSHPDPPQTPLLIELWVLTQLETLMKCVVSLYCCGEEEKKRILLMELFLG